MLHGAWFVQLPTASQSTCCQLYATSVLPHCRRHVDDVSVTRQSGGSTCTQVLNFGRFSVSKSGVDLYANWIYTWEYTVCHTSLVTAHINKQPMSCDIQLAWGRFVYITHYSEPPLQCTQHTLTDRNTQTDRQTDSFSPVTFSSASWAQKNSVLTKGVNTTTEACQYYTLAAYVDGTFTTTFTIQLNLERQAESAMISVFQKQLQLLHNFRVNSLH